MMDYKRLSLSKMGDKLIKTLEAKEHFDRREQEKSYVKKIQILKEILTQEYKFVTQNKVAHSVYATRSQVLEKHISYIKKIQNNKIFETSDKQIIDTLLAKYS
jgi:hypothetical protein